MRVQSGRQPGVGESHPHTGSSAWKGHFCLWGHLHVGGHLCVGAFCTWGIVCMEGSFTCRGRWQVGVVCLWGSCAPRGRVPLGVICPQGHLHVGYSHRVWVDELSSGTLWNMKRSSPCLVWVDLGLSPSSVTLGRPLGHCLCLGVGHL